jgi:hypothetical protein
MTQNGVSAELTDPPGPAGAVRRLKGESSSALADLVATFEELQVVLRCCERLVAELAVSSADGPDEVVVEAVWTMALLSYARCFSDGGGTSKRLDVADLTTVQPQPGVTEWHQILLQLRDHYADPATNPRERFTVGVTQDAGGAASGVAITSVRQPLVDDLTVRQTGAIAYALSGLVNTRIEAQQQKVSEELKLRSRVYLDKLERLDLERPDHPG